ncbi:MAG: response regulator [Anaerolineales bacterium]
MIDPQGSPIDLPAVIDEAINFTREQLAGGEVATIAEYPAHLPAVSGDKKRLVALAACLLQQAGHLTTRGEVKVRADLLSSDQITAASVDQPLPETLSSGGPWVLLRVSFSAPMADSADILALADSGDWITRECGAMLQSYDDHFWLTEAQGDYTFHLALPIWAAYDVSTNVASLRQAVESRLTGGAAQQRLLLNVEDDDLRALLQREFESAGYEVLPVASGEEILPTARREQPNLILLDLLARSPTAFEVAGILKHDRKTRHLPVLFLTSIDDPHGGTSMGTVSFLPRQADTGAVISAVNAVLTSGLTPSARVLVVEQDDRMRDHMVMTIQAQGYRVSEAGTPEEAMALAERATPEVALVNAKLAQERDYWLLRGLRNTAREAEIYVMADVLDEAEARAAMKRGASGYSETGQLPDLLERMRQRRRKDQPD